MGIPRKIRKIVRKKSGGVCEVCKVSVASHMHHPTYARKGNELSTDLEHVCLACHGKYHPNHEFVCKINKGRPHKIHRMMLTASEAKRRRVKPDHLFHLKKRIKK